MSTERRANFPNPNFALKSVISSLFIFTWILTMYALTSCARSCKHMRGFSSGLNKIEVVLGLIYVYPFFLQFFFPLPVCGSRWQSLTTQPHWCNKCSIGLKSGETPGMEAYWCPVDIRRQSLDGKREVTHNSADTDCHYRYLYTIIVLVRYFPHSDCSHHPHPHYGDTLSLVVMRV